MAVTVAASWGAAQAVPASGSQPPRALSLPVTVANTAGDWMVAVIAWRQLDAGAGVSVTVEDDACNWWEPLGAPSADSSTSGVMRTAVWAAPAARAATTVTVAPTGSVTGIAATVLDVSGMTAWMSVTGVATAYANAATALSALSLSAPASQALVVTGCGSDVATGTITGPGAGWTSLARQSATDGADHLGDVALNCAWELSTAGPSASWSSSAAQDLSGVIAALLVTVAAPVQPNPDWPVVVTEIAPGAGASAPPSELAWASVSSRALGFSATQGAPYLLGGLQAGQGTMSLDNVDGALIPPGTGPYAGIDSGTPARIRAVLPSQASPWYVPWCGTLQQLPQAWDEIERGMTAATITDAYAYTTRNVPPALRAEIGSEPFLYAYWPLSEPAGAMYAGNIAPGNQNPLAVTLSKYGSGGAAQAFGANTGGLKGDPQSGMWSQSGVTAPGSGYTLDCADGGFPSISGGVTIEGWFQCTATSTPSEGPWLLTLSGIGGQILEVLVNGSVTTFGATGNLVLADGAYANQFVLSSAQDFLTAPLFHLVVAFTRTSWTAYVNGAKAASGNFSPSIPPAFTRLDIGGFLYPSPGGQGDMYAAHVAVYSGLLPASRVLAHYQAGATAFAGESASWRIERLLGYAGALGRRLILPETGVDVTPMASLSTLASSSAATATAGGYATGSGTPAATALQDMASSTPPGYLTVSPTGAITYVPRQYACNQAVRWALGDWAAQAVYDVVVAADAPAAWWKLADKPGATSVVDYSGNGHGGTASSVVFGVPGPAAGDSAASFNGTSAKVDTTYNPALTALTVEAWVNLAGLAQTGNPRIMANSHTDSSSDYSGFELWLSSSAGRYKFQIGSGTGVATVTSAASIASSGWTHLAATWDGATARLYVNGSLAGSSPFTGPYAVGKASIGIGYDPAYSGDWVAGDIAQAAVYTTALPAARIAAHYAAGGEIPYQGDIAFGYDPARVVNDIQLTQPDTGVVTVPSLSALAASSQAKYGDLSYQVTAYLQNDPTSAYTAGPGIGDLANWLAATNAAPALRLGTVTVDAASHPASWPFVLGAACGDMVTVNRRPPTSDVVLSVTGRISQIQRSLSFGEGGRVEGSLQVSIDAAPEYLTLTCDDSVRGQLSGANLLGW